MKEGDAYAIVLDLNTRNLKDRIESQYMKVRTILSRPANLKDRIERLVSVKVVVVALTCPGI